MAISLGKLSSLTTWKNYASSQGMVQLGFLMIGLVLAGATSYCGPRLGKITSGGEMLEYDLTLEPTKPTALTDYVSVENFSSMTVYTQTTAPEKATVILYGARGQGNDAEVRRIVSGPTWTKWEEGISYSSLRLVVERSSEPAVPPAAVETTTSVAQPRNDSTPAVSPRDPETSPSEPNSSARLPVSASPQPTVPPTVSPAATPLPTQSPETQGLQNSAANQTRVKVIIYLKPRTPANANR
jgi:hypothetical protein